MRTYNLKATNYKGDEIVMLMLYNFRKAVEKMFPDKNKNGCTLGKRL